MATRQGKHKAGKVRMGIYVEPFRKAVAILAANVAAKRAGEDDPYTMTDIVWIGIERIAKDLGILNPDGSASEQFKDQLDLMVDMVKQSDVNG